MRASPSLPGFQNSFILISCVWPSRSVALTLSSRSEPRSTRLSRMQARMSSTVIVAGSVFCAGLASAALASFLAAGSAEAPAAKASNAVATKTLRLPSFIVTPLLDSVLPGVGPKSSRCSEQPTGLSFARRDLHHKSGGKLTEAPATPRLALLLWIAAALIWFAPLGCRDLVHPDEGRYSEISR